MELSFIDLRGSDGFSTRRRCRPGRAGKVFFVPSTRPERPIPSQVPHGGASAGATGRISPSTRTSIDEIA